MNYFWAFAKATVLWTASKWLTVYIELSGFVHQRHHLPSLFGCSPEAAEASFSGTNGTLLRNCQQLVQIHSQVIHLCTHTQLNKNLRGLSTFSVTFEKQLSISPHVSIYKTVTAVTAPSQNCLSSLHPLMQLRKLSDGVTVNCRPHISTKNVMQKREKLQVNSQQTPGNWLNHPNTNICW